MCGRFNLSTPPEMLAAVFKLAAMPPWKPRYNIAPSQRVPVIRVLAEGGGRHCDLLQWGLVPAWADDPKIGNRMINARSESAADKPAFRSAFRRRRCLVPANGFYEWQKIAGGEKASGKITGKAGGNVENVGGRKQPFYVHARDDRPLAFAGLWESWQREGQQPVESFTILTTQANDLVKPIHDRMPVIIHPDDFEAWLDPAQQDVAVLARLLSPPPAGELVAYPVSSRVNSPGHDDPACAAPMTMDSAQKNGPESLFEA